MEEKSNNRVLIGLTGRVDSTVAAYLLKKQGFEVIGVAISFSDHSIGTSPAPACHITDLDFVKKCADFLEIPLYAVSAHREYEAIILEKVVARRLSGRNFAPCFHCNTLKIDFLLEKAKLLGASKIASAHFAKVSHNQKNGQYYVMRGVDPEHDESHLLSALKQHHLEKLILPLGELTKEKVIKIAESIGMKIPDGRPKEEMCFSNSDEFRNYLNRVAPKDLRKSGFILNHQDNSSLGDHDGVFQFTIGQKGITSLGNNTMIDPSWQVVKINAVHKSVYLAEAPFTYQSIAIGNAFMTVKIDFSKPLRAFVRLSLDRKVYPAIILFKNNNRAVIHFEEELVNVYEGVHVTIYNRNDPSARVIGAGEVNYLDNFEPLDRVDLYTKEDRYKKKKRRDPFAKKEDEGDEAKEKKHEFKV